MNVAVKPGATGLATPVLEVRNLKTQFFTDEGVVRAVDGVSFSVAAGEALGIVGESGSGKSVTALSLMRLLEEPSRIVGGDIRFQGRDVLGADPEEMRNLRGGRMAMVFQDPMTSLNPVLRIARQLVETMVVHGNYTGDQATDRAVKMLGRMGINAPERAIHSYPHQFSGGMRQRVVLAMGMSNDPVLLIADEPTTALDVTIQAQILELLRELNRDFGTAIVLISHDLGVIAGVCARVVVMYAGEVVEEGSTEEVLSDPRHPYTWALINAVPRIDRHTPGNRRLTTIEGAPPDPLDLPQGCRFAPRCPFRIERCTEHPELLAVAPGRDARCWVTQAGGRLALPPSSSRLRGEGLGDEADEASPQGEGEGRGDAAAYHAHRIAHGVPEGGKDFLFNDAFPHEALMDQLNGVDFDKGCYVGQEVVSRMQHRGTARTRIMPVIYEDGFAAEPWSEVTAGARNLGKVGTGANGRGLV
ncbi:MAG: oligopeptide/dipeptide ABC transporter ATP-binding protein, partial [Microvirga sp.]